MTRQKWTYDEEKAEKPIRFIESMVKHIIGEYAGSPFLLEEWQKQIILQAFGWVDKAGKRKHRFVYVELPKGNGKSFLLSAIVIYLCCAEQIARGENYCVAGDRFQARIIFDACRAMIEGSKRLKGAFEVYKNSIIHKKTQSVIHVISADASTKHGFRPYCIAFDELHVQPNRELYDTLTKGMIKLPNSMCWMITTAGVKNTFAETIHDYADKVRRKVIKDDAWMAVMYAADEQDDPFKEETWAKCNPAYGKFIRPDDFRIVVQEAKNNPSALNSFKRLHLNLWTGSVEAWIPVHTFDEAAGELDFDELEKYPCYLGLDLASNRDLTALAAVWDLGGRYAWHCWFWCPEETVTERARLENVNYEAWVREGLVETTPGNVIDLAYIEERLVSVCDKYDVKKIGFDPWSAKNFAAVMIEKHFMPMVQVKQTISHLSESTKKLEAWIVEKRIVHAGNPVLRWMIDNVQIYRDTNDNIRAHKGKSRGKIDGVAATILAIHQVLENIQPETIDEIRFI